MRISQEIQVLDLLALREAEFLRVRECEEKIRQILGGNDFPFPAPPVALPSTNRKGKPFRPTGIVPPAPSKKHDRRQTMSTAQDDCVQEIPPLDPEKENAYRVVFEDKGEIKVSYLQNADSLREMMALPCDSFKITCVESVLFRQLDDYKVLRRLL